MPFWYDGSADDFPSESDLAGKTLEEAEHRAMHAALGTFLEEMQFALLVPRYYTPEIHTTDSPDFARGTFADPDSPRGKSWGVYFVAGKWVWGQATVRSGDIGFNPGNGFYSMTLPVTGYIPDTVMPRIGTATVGSGVNFKHYNMGVHLGGVNDSQNGDICCFTYNDGTFMYGTENTIDTPIVPEWSTSGGEIHAIFGPYLAA